jgi:hypothetical protein
VGLGGLQHIESGRRGVRSTLGRLIASRRE